MNGATARSAAEGNLLFIPTNGGLIITGIAKYASRHWEIGLLVMHITPLQGAELRIYNGAKHRQEKPHYLPPAEGDPFNPSYWTPPGHTDLSGFRVSLSASLGMWHRLGYCPRVDGPPPIDPRESGAGGLGVKKLSIPRPCIATLGNPIARSAHHTPARGRIMNGATARSAAEGNPLFFPPTDALPGIIDVDSLM